MEEQKAKNLYRALINDQKNIFYAIGRKSQNIFVS